MVVIYEIIITNITVTFIIKMVLLSIKYMIIGNDISKFFFLKMHEYPIIII